MSRERIITGLEGYSRIKPCFPAIVDELNTQLNAAPGITISDLKRIGQNIDGFDGIDRAKTEDGHEWLCVLLFKKPGGKVAILIPRAEDWDNKGGVALDRSVVVYTTDGYQEMKRVLEEFQRGLQNYLKDQRKYRRR